LPQEFTLEQERFVKGQELGRGAYGVVCSYVSQTPGRNALPRRLAAKCDVSGNSTIGKETYFMAKMMKAGL